MYCSMACRRGASESALATAPAKTVETGPRSLIIRSHHWPIDRMAMRRALCMLVGGPEEAGNSGAGTTYSLVGVERGTSVEHAVLGTGREAGGAV